VFYELSFVILLLRRKAIPLPTHLNLNSVQQLLNLQSHRARIVDRAEGLERHLSVSGLTVAI